METDEPSSGLQKRKQYRKLVNASPLVADICKRGEKYFRFFNKTTGVFNRNIKNLGDILISNTMNNLSSSVLSAFKNHLYDDEAFDNHPFTLIRLMLKIYFKVRIHYETVKNQIPFLKTELEVY